MGKGYLIENKNLNEAARIFLEELFNNGIIESVIAQKENVKGKGAFHYLLKKDELDGVKPFIPFMPENAASIVSRFTREKPSPKSVAVVLRPCELRALVELVKFNQADLENIILIGIDCLGTYDNVDFQKESHDFPRDNSRLRFACQICVTPEPLVADIKLSFLGEEDGLWVIPASEKGEEILKKLGYELKDVPETREKRIKEIEEERRKLRVQKFESFEKNFTGIEGFTEFFAYCLNCKNCMEACPICFCKECFFKSPALTWDSEVYLRKLESKGGFRMPEDPIFFHLGRLVHVTPSCVGCGICGQACPVDIEVGLVFNYLSEKVQEAFDYMAGRNLDEKPILTTFKEDELIDLVW